MTKFNNDEQFFIDETVKRIKKLIEGETDKFRIKMCFEMTHSHPLIKNMMRREVYDEIERIVMEGIDKENKPLFEE